MSVGMLSLLALALPASGAGPVTDERPPLNAVTAVRLANYGMPSVLVSERQQVRALVDELVAARKKPWRRGDSRLGCYSTVVLLVREKPHAIFRVASQYVVERPLEKGKSSYSLALSDDDLPVLRKRLAEISPPLCKVPASR